MINLLKSNLEIIKRGKVKYVFLIPIMASLYILLWEYIVYRNSTVYIEDFIFIGGVVIGLFIATLTSLFVGGDFNNGTIRNKIINGYSKTKIYLANLITLITISVLAYILYFFLLSFLGYFIFDGYLILLKDILLNFLRMILVVIMYVSIFTSFSYMIGEKTSSLLVNIFYVIIGAGLVSILLSSSILQESEINADIELINGEYVTTYTENPDYQKHKINRIIYTVIINSTPMGQTMEINDGYYSGLVLDKKHYCLMIYSSSVSIIMTGLGLIVFKRKNVY